MIEAYLKKETLKKEEIKKDNNQTIAGVKIED